MLEATDATLNLLGATLPFLLLQKLPEHLHFSCLPERLRDS